MNVTAANIANARTTKTETGEPYRRKMVNLSTRQNALAGVTVGNIVEDRRTEFRRVHMPGHPEADQQGFVRMPNVELPVEMMNLMAAGRAYQANAAVIKQYRALINSALQLLA